MKPLRDDGEQDPEAMSAMRRRTADQIRAASGGRDGIVAAIEAFLDFGDAGDYSPFELWDYFSISAPTVPALAGCDAAAEDRVVRIFSTCTHARYGGGRPRPADWPWLERTIPPLQARSAAPSELELVRPTRGRTRRVLLWGAAVGGLLLLLMAGGVAVFQEPLRAWLFPPPWLQVQQWYTTERISTGPFGHAPKGEGKTILIVEMRFPPHLIGTRMQGGGWKAQFDTSEFVLVFPDGSVVPPAFHTVWPGTSDMEYSPFGDEWTQQPRVFNLGGERRLPEHFSWKLAFGILDKSLKAGSPRIQYKDGTSGILTPEKRATRK